MFTSSVKHKPSKSTKDKQVQSVNNVHSFQTRHQRRPSVCLTSLRAQVHPGGGEGAGGGAFSRFRGFRGECSTIHSPPAPFFLKVEISSRTLIPVFMPGSVHSDSFPTLSLDSGIIRPLRLRCVKGVCMFRCNPPPALLAE